MNILENICNIKDVEETLEFARTQNTINTRGCNKDIDTELDKNSFIFLNPLSEK